MLTGKKILVGITGSIAAYKSIILVRLLVKAGAEVRVVMTPAAKDFVSPLVLSTLSKNKVYCELAEADEWSNHVELGRWADLFIIAPLSCNTLAKMAHGFCDNILLAVYLSATCSVVVAPAMDEDMWKHPSTKQNLAKLISFGNTVMEVNHGELASGLIGDGRMAEPESIIQFIQSSYFRNNSLAGKKALVTAGPTYESIDPVRFIGNHSSAKMGFAIAEALYMEGAEVYLITGPSSEQIQFDGIHKMEVQSASEMYDQVMALFTQMDIGVFSAAVADYTVFNPAVEKIKKKDAELNITLTKTKDILAEAGNTKKPHQLIIGFALETENEKVNALDKLARKNADFIVLNSLRNEGAGFAGNNNAVTIFSKSGMEKSIGLKSKKAIAKDIVSLIKETVNV
ncbi:MAG: bifunctional phosphopantothenoylcysteine decarboxylase/phosphopantothenate--cysteine ligase CoaBC [Sediminibacterium sp.]|nr:bifunctional phosphopantothenoylcysteine decarboxylase/phosphopantothenate--cysteine ligase CoaBC [Sediminibacterium sp.]TXT34383.1 MAG: phosphopantothenoylcysteine decarboxylase / phosphopantothenate--cysteine ligase [Chitinophagaceae bacterium]